MVKHSAIFETLELGLRKQDQLLRPLETSKSRNVERRSRKISKSRNLEVLVQRKYRNRNRDGTNTLSSSGRAAGQKSTMGCVCDVRE